MLNARGGETGNLKSKNRGLITIKYNGFISIVKFSMFEIQVSPPYAPEPVQCAYPASYLDGQHFEMKTYEFSSADSPSNFSNKLGYFFILIDSL